VYQHSETVSTSASHGTLLKAILWHRIQPDHLFLSHSCNPFQHSLTSISVSLIVLPWNSSSHCLLALSHYRYSHHTAPSQISSSSTEHYFLLATEGRARSRSKITIHELCRGPVPAKILATFSWGWSKHNKHPSYFGFARLLEIILHPSGITDATRTKIIHTSAAQLHLWTIQLLRSPFHCSSHTKLLQAQQHQLGFSAAYPVPANSLRSLLSRGQGDRCDYLRKSQQATRFILRFAIESKITNRNEAE